MSAARPRAQAGRRRSVALLAPALAIAAVAQAGTIQPWEVWRDPHALARLDPADLVLEASSRCPGGCRYDRSNPGPENPSDNPYPLRWLYRDGAEVVLLDARGAGALTRLWLTTGDGVSRCIDPALRIRMRFDDEATPRVDVPLAALFDGSTAPFTPPLVADRDAASGGYLSLVPIAWRSALRIGLVGADNGPHPCIASGWKPLWYQMQYHTLAPGSVAASFDPAADPAGLRAFLAHAGDDPWHGLLAPQAVGGTLAAGTTLTLAQRSGAGWLRGIRLNVPEAARAAIRLRLTFDGAVTTDVPLADFFASPGGERPARTLLFGEDVGGTLYAWFPMPYADGVQVDLVAAATLAAPVAIGGDLYFEPGTPPSDSGRYHAELSGQCVAAGDLSLYAARGAGKLVGIAARYRADGIASLGYLEGDERAVLDDATAPAWIGTGVEDFYNGGFYFDHGDYALPLSAATRVDADGTGVTAVQRLLLGDALAYTQSLRLAQEAGFAPGLPVPTCLRHVTHAYRSARPSLVTHDRFEIGDAPAAAAHAYVAPPAAVCAPLDALYADEPPTARHATVCRFATGSSRFVLHLRGGDAPPRLRRTFDAGLGMPGSVAGAPAAQIRVDGIVVGHFDPAPAEPLRRWQQQEAPLALVPTPGPIEFEIVPEVGMPAASFSESAWELRGGWVDGLFVDGFDGDGVGEE